MHINMTKYKVFVNDNFHYMDETERYELGTFETCEEAINACKKIVDEYLMSAYKKGMMSNELYESYLMFGEDPFIVCEDNHCTFSAWDYAKKKCGAVCEE